MNTYPRLTLVALAAAALMVLAPDARADIPRERVTVTFSAPVRVPGKVLPAGTYVFEALKNGRVTRILSADERRIYATLITVPTEQKEPAENPEVILGGSKEGVKDRVEAWFYPGDSVGSEFIFNGTRSKKNVASVIGAFGREAAGKVEQVPRAAALSSEFVIVGTGRVVEKSSSAVFHAAKRLVL